MLPGPTSTKYQNPFTGEPVLKFKDERILLVISQFGDDTWKLMERWSGRSFTQPVPPVGNTQASQKLLLVPLVGIMWDQRSVRSRHGLATPR